MRKVLLLAVLVGGCASQRLKPVDAEKVPVQRPEGAQAEATMTVAETIALGRVLSDAQALLWPVEEGGAVCQYTPQALSVMLFPPDAAGARYVIVGYNPDNCPIPANFPLIHKDLAYVLTPDGKLLGPRVRGR